MKTQETQVTDMKLLFEGAKYFNRPLDKWNVSTNLKYKQKYKQNWKKNSPHVYCPMTPIRTPDLTRKTRATNWHSRIRQIGDNLGCNVKFFF